MPYATQTPEQRKAANLKAYAKKLGLTVEQLEARRAAAREWKARNKNRRTKDGYVPIDSDLKQKPGVRPGKKRSGGPKTCLDPIWEQLKKKHAKWAGTRLEKSINPPEFLDSDRGREVRRSKQVKK